VKKVADMDSVYIYVNAFVTVMVGTSLYSETQI